MICFNQVRNLGPKLLRHANGCLVVDVSQCTRFLSTTVAPIAKSNRKAWKEIAPEAKIIDYLDRLHLGYLPKRSERVALAKKFERFEEEDKTIRGGGVKVVKIKDAIKKAKAPYPFTEIGKFESTSKLETEIPQPFGYDPKELKKIDEKSGIVLNTAYNTPEIAIIGRSNVGKSTLLNELLNFNSSYVQKCTVSDRPGETKQLSFYSIGRYIEESLPKHVKAPPSLILVDMPGYGFAYLSDNDQERCYSLCMSYLLLRGSPLKRVLLLVDARHGLKASDTAFFKELSLQLSNLRNTSPSSNAHKMSWKLQVVITKCDLIERKDLARRLQVLKENMFGLLPSSIIHSSLPVMAVSSKEKKGIIELTKELAGISHKSRGLKRAYKGERTSKRMEVNGATSGLKVDNDDAEVAPVKKLNRKQKRLLRQSNEKKEITSNIKK